jgi:hypothetical protein
VAVCLAFFASLTACGDNEPPPPAGTGGTGAGGAGGTAAGGAGGSVDAGPIDPDAAAAPTYYPFKVGNSWTYLVTQLNHADETKVHVITRMEAVGGTGPFKDTVAFRVETQKSSATGLPDGTISWQGIEGNRIVRYRETSCRGGQVTVTNGTITNCGVNEEDWWMPARVVIDNQPSGMPYATGLKWNETYTEWVTTFPALTPTMGATAPPVNKTDAWEIVNADVAITTPAGAFTGCALIKKTSMASAAKQYTFCKGVGKVKEEGASMTAQNETLQAFTVAP